jgi:hypothetical protein
MAHARPFSTSTLQDLSNGIRNTSKQGVLTPTIKLWNLVQVPTFRSVNLILTLASKWGSRLMLKVANFSWSLSFLALSFLGFFCLLILVLSSCSYFLFFYSCTIATTGKITTQTSNSVSEGKGTPEKPTMVVILSFCKPKLLISLTCLLNTHRTFTH